MSLRFATPLLNMKFGILKTDGEFSKNFSKSSLLFEGHTECE
jgi:hypothetical protein